MQLWTFGLISFLLLSIWMTQSVVMPYPDADDPDQSGGNENDCEYCYDPSVIEDDDSDDKLNSTPVTSSFSIYPSYSKVTISSTPKATPSLPMVTQSKASCSNDDDDDDGDDGDDCDEDNGSAQENDECGENDDDDDDDKKTQSIICKTSPPLKNVKTPKSLTKTSQRQAANKQRSSKKIRMTKGIKNTSDKRKMSSTPFAVITRTISVKSRKPRISSYSVSYHSISSSSFSLTTTSSFLAKHTTSTNIQKSDGTRMSTDTLFLITSAQTSVLTTSIFSTVTLSSMPSAIISPTTAKLSKAPSSSNDKGGGGDEDDKMSTSATFNTSTRIPTRETIRTKMSTEIPPLSTSVPTSNVFSLTTITTPPLSSTMSSKSNEKTAPSPPLPSFSSEYSSSPPLFSSASSTSSGNITQSSSMSSFFGRSFSISPSLSPVSLRSSRNIAPSPSLSSFKVEYSVTPTLLSSNSSDERSNITPTSSSSSLPTFVSLTGNTTSKSTPNIKLTPSLSSTSVYKSRINATGIVLSSNTIAPTRSTFIVVSTSVAKQEPMVYCRSTSTGEKFEKGTLQWNDTPVGGRANAPCKYNSKNNTAIAYRYCLMNTTTMAQYWSKVRDENCSALEKDTSMEELTKVEITEENENTMAVLIDYITGTSNATVDFVKDGANFLEKLIDGATNLSKIRKEVLSSISNVMNADPAVLAEANKEHQSTTKILKKMGKLMDDMSLSGQKSVREQVKNLVAEAWDVANKSEDLKFETNSTDALGGSLVSVTLPSSLLHRYKEKTRITFINFMNDNLFPQSLDHTKRFINSKIVSASVKGDEVKNLSEPVIIEFRITNDTYAKNCSCVFWDFEADGGLGRWSSNGCSYKFIGDGVARCSCDHLTHFAVLVDLFPNNEPEDTDKLILEGITFVGCYLSIAGLVLTMITLISFKQYRNGVSGLILLNLCLSLLFSLVIFLGGIEQVDDEGTCVTMGALLHYFVLVAVLWMGIEAFHMFVNIVLDRVPGQLGKKFVLKCAIVAWVLPMLIVVITVLVSTDDYKNDQYCRVQGKSFYIAFLVPTLTVLVFNVIIFALVVKALQSTRIPSNRHKQGIVHFRRVLGIAIVFGITWLFGVLAIGELRLIFQYLFCITNSFQGFMIFILYCLTDRKVRERLVRFLCALPDPNKNRIIDSTSTQRPTDIDINLSMFEAQPSTRSRNWSGTWPMSGHANPARITPDDLTVYPRPARPGYIPDFMHESGYSSNIVESSFHANLPRSMYNPNPVSPAYDPDLVWECDRDEFELPYNYRNPPGSQPVTNIPLPGEVSGDALVDSTLAQYLERSGGEMSLQSANSIVFFNDGQRVVVPKYPELAGSNNNWDDKKVDPLQVSRTYDADEPQTPEGPRRYSQGGDGLSFFKKPRQQRHSSATTSAELDKRFYPKGRVHKNKGVHFSADQLATSPREPERWSDVGDVPRLKTHSRPEDISEIDEHQERSKYKPRRIKSAQPLRRVIADDEVEEEYYRNYRGKFDREHGEVTSNFIAAEESKNSREIRKPASTRELPAFKTESEVQFGQEPGSSSSDTSSDTSFRWSEATEAGHAPNLKSYSLTTFSDLTSDDGLDDGTHFTQF